MPEVEEGAAAVEVLSSISRAKTGPLRGPVRGALFLLRGRKV